MRDAEVNKAGLLQSGYDLDLVSQRLRRAAKEGGRVMGSAQGVGSYRADQLRRNVAETFSEAFQRAQRSSLCFLGEVAIGIQTRRESNSIAHAVENVQLVVHHPNHEHVEAVRGSGGERRAAHSR